ncbi:MAG: hypothetical protein FD156_1873 [Nitrospirae bacterium]|nr:MAG: hypothetical protein FD156_1873 [Nitrospirota bacterium]
MSNIVKFPHWIKSITDTFDNGIKTIGTDRTFLNWLDTKKGEDLNFLILRMYPVEASKKVRQRIISIGKERKIN